MGIFSAKLIFVWRIAGTGAALFVSREDHYFSDVSSSSLLVSFGFVLFCFGSAEPFNPSDYWLHLMSPDAKKG